MGFNAHPGIHRETAVFVPQHLFCLEVLQQPTAHKGAQILAAQQHDALRTYTLAMTGFVLPLTVITLVAVMMRRKPPAG